MTDPVVIDTNRYHDALAENSRRWNKAFADATQEVRWYTSEDWKQIGRALAELSLSQLKEMAGDIHDDAALGELVRNLVIRHRAEEIYEERT